MNHSIYSADRMTHLKIVVVALVAGIAVAGFGISARINSDANMQTARITKAGAPVTVSSSARRAAGSRVEPTGRMRTSRPPVSVVPRRPR